MISLKRDLSMRPCAEILWATLTIYLGKSNNLAGEL